MKIDHIAVWTEDIKTMRRFYLTYFGVSCGEKYINPVKRYTSYFLTFPRGGVRIELMNRPGVAEANENRGMVKGWAHLSVSLGSREEVDRLTDRLRNDGCVIAGEPRVTGDGYYESVVLDPEGNYIELVE